MKISKKIADQYTKAYMDLIDISNEISKNDTIKIKEFGDIKVGDIYINQEEKYFWIRCIDLTQEESNAPKKINIKLEFLDPNEDPWEKSPIVNIIELSSKYKKVNISEENFLYGLSIGDEFKMKECSVTREAEVVGFLHSKEPLVLTKVRMDDFGFPVDKQKDKTWKETIKLRNSKKLKTIEKLYLAHPKDLKKI